MEERGNGTIDGMIENRQMQAQLAGLAGLVSIELVRKPVALGIEQKDSKN